MKRLTVSNYGQPFLIAMKFKSDKYIQEQKLDWNIFKSANLSRVDLYYFRKVQNTDQKEQLEKFFSDSISKLAKITKKIILD